jgi:CcmD family protein
VSDLTWLFIAFLAVWGGIGGYLFSVMARQKRIEARLRALELERRH